MTMGATRPPHKRQRTSASHSTVASTESTPLSIITTNGKVLESLACKSCHRFITATQGVLFMCSRCSAPTCAVCSRTCTTRVSSPPPTPHLTWSPSPSPSQSPRSLENSVDLDSNGNTRKIPKIIGKRRKDAGDDHADTADNDDQSDIDESGCGRNVCRDCCIENIQGDTISCYDCYDHEGFHDYLPTST